MIIRKPYAFLIKYFKIIHIAIFILLSILLFKLRAIYMFFKNYLLTGTYIYVSNMASKYIGIPLIFISIILIGAFLLIFLLMKQKKKPIIYYLSALIYASLCFISFIVLTSVFSSLEFSSLSNRTIALLRDLSMILYYADFIFIIVSFIRGFGFDIKKFNFDKDLQVLDITEKDREEIELGSPIDYDKVVNFARKRKRNFLYYIKENSYILIVFLVVLSLGLISYISIDKFIINKVYGENQVISIDKLDFVIKDCFLSNKDINGNNISKTKKFIVIPFNITNNYEESIRIVTENTRIKVNNNYYYPIVNNSFKDLGTVYKNQLISNGNSKNYLFVFEVDNEEKVKNIYLELYAGKTTNNKELVYNYKTIKLLPNDFIKKDLGNYKLNDLVVIDNDFIKNTKLSINTISLTDSDNYKYTKCGNDSEGTCLDYNASVSASIGKTLLKINYSLTDSVDIFKYVSLSYKLNDKSYLLTSNYINDVTPSNYPDKVVFLEIDDNIKSATNLVLNFNIRNTEFKYEISE